MRILLVNDPYFLASLRRLGHEVFFASPAPEADLHLDATPVQIEEIVKACSFNPDFILISDSIDVRPALLGLENVKIPKVFYGIDSPLNEFWQFNYVQAFDLAFLDQAAPVRKLRMDYPDKSNRFHWLPLAADPLIYRKLDLSKKYDITFVGSIHEQLRPKRTWLLKTLQNHFKLNVFDGDGKRSLPPKKVVRLFNQSKVVLNENLFPGLNLRTFEALACGVCLLTESSDASWQSFFKDWEHLVTYDPVSLVHRAEKLLKDEELREGIAEKGRALVLEKHTIDRRAEELLKIVAESLPQIQAATADKIRLYHLGCAFIQQANRWPRQPVGALKSEGIRLLMSLAKNRCELAEIHFELAAQALQENRPEQARDSLERALEIDASHLRSHWAFFWCLRESGDSKMAVQELERLCHHLGLEETDRIRFAKIGTGSVLTASDYLFLGQILEKAGWLLEPGVDRSIGHPCRWNAFDAYQKAIALDPKLWSAYLHCARVLEHHGSPEFAVVLMQRAVELRPWEFSLRLKLGYLLLRSYRREEGLEQLVKYLVNSTDPDKWERVEKLSVSESECQHILDAVWEHCRKSGDADGQSELSSEVRRRTLQRVSRRDSIISRNKFEKAI